MHSFVEDNKVSILDGIIEEIGSDKVIFSEGVNRRPQEFKTISNEHLFYIEKGKKVNGLKGEYFDNINLEGPPKITRTDKQVKFGWTLFSPHHDILHGWYSVRRTGKIKSPITEKVNIGISGNDGYRLFINEKLLIDNLKENLKNQEEIHEVYIEGSDKILKSQIFIFIATMNSIKLETCLHDLGVALSYGIETIPIKGEDIKEWKVLNQIGLNMEGHDGFNLSEKKGFEYNVNNFKGFCNDLYNYIKQFKREVNLFESKEKKIDQQKENIKNIFEKLINSKEFRENIENKIPLFKKLLIEVKGRQISVVEFFIRCGQILEE